MMDINSLLISNQTDSKSGLHPGSSNVHYAHTYPYVVCNVTTQNVLVVGICIQRLAFFNECGKTFLTVRISNPPSKAP